MRLLEQSITKNLDLSEEFSLNHSYKKALWKFYAAHAFALSLLGRVDRKARAKSRLWRKFLLGREGVESKRYQKMQRLIAEDQKDIVDALKYIQEQKEASGGYFGGFYKDGTVAILSYEYPQDD